ncbi:uncharacterized protein PHACADRAFT_174292 [Phanerochaete carnosa HHB-10118-sp]|uniref:DUF6697 domain-containing protein n=1 Tax=Phanerochaete carnosa (strain HHB-10118-sp) TaxID=650164 RepID=K5VX19_PHACS|nr:uncharacterized protein PHACADRAFT_174292 [Phanerochaete carnosa HHB-10118-sp]EKM56118.1 hypothetical protein PHACADRAFT_174292 [Phanerochaete carnosa HHB-10118-sp]
MADSQVLSSPLFARAPSAQAQSPGIYTAAGARRGLTTPSLSYLDQLRVTEALLARDHAVYQMESVCASNRTKEAVIVQLRHEKENLEAKLASEMIPAESDTERCKEIEMLRKSNTELTAKLESLSLHPEGTPTMLAMAMQLSPNLPHELLSPSIANYRIFQEKTTCWCPVREEHGYYLTPFFKCSTNPRVITAHRWHAVDLDSEINRPTECFFNKEGKWYYAGVYKTFRLRDIAPQEWIKLPAETTQVLVKETVAHRKNVSPQNIYEVGQLYAAGALKAACIGLQCIGFNDTLYKGLLAQAELCAKTGRWRGLPGSVGLGTGAIWNANANVGPGLGSTPSGPAGPTGTGGDAVGMIGLSDA